MQPPTIRLTYSGLAVALALLAIFVAGDLLLADWLALDLNCLDQRMSRRSEAVEMVICAASAGPRGWFFLAWLAAPMLLFAVWLRRAVRSAGR